MNRTQYRTARRMLRDNGYYSLRWMSEQARSTFEQLRHQRDDPYAEIAFFFRSHATTVGSRLVFRYRFITKYGQHEYTASKAVGV